MIFKTIKRLIEIKEVQLKLENKRTKLLTLILTELRINKKRK